MLFFVKVDNFNLKSGIIWCNVYCLSVCNAILSVWYFPLGDIKPLPSNSAMSAGV